MAWSPTSICPNPRCWCSSRRWRAGNGCLRRIPRPWKWSIAFSPTATPCSSAEFAKMFPWVIFWKTSNLSQGRPVCGKRFFWYWLSPRRWWCCGWQRRRGWISCPAAEASGRFPVRKPRRRMITISSSSRRHGRGYNSYRRAGRYCGDSVACQAARHCNASWGRRTWSPSQGASRSRTTQ